MGTDCLNVRPRAYLRAVRAVVVGVVRQHPASLRHLPSPGADVAGVSPVPSQMWQGEPSPGADVAGVSPVPSQMWQGRAKSQCRCGRGEPSPGADAGDVSSFSPAQMCCMLHAVCSVI